MSIYLKTGRIDGRLVGYCSETVFLVQLGKGPKGSYKTRYRIIGNLTQAVALYTSLNISSNHKKRLLMPAAARNPVLAIQSLCRLYR